MSIFIVVKRAWYSPSGSLRRGDGCGDGDDAGVAVVADLFSYKAVDKSSMPLHRLPAVCLADAVFTPNQLLFIIIDFYDYWCAAAATSRAAPRLVVGGCGGKQSKLRGVDFAPMQ